MPRRPGQRGAATTLQVAEIEVGELGQGVQHGRERNDRLLISMLEDLKFKGLGPAGARVFPQLRDLIQAGAHGGESENGAFVSVVWIVHDRARSQSSSSRVIGGLYGSVLERRADAVVRPGLGEVREPLHFYFNLQSVMLPLAFDPVPRGL